MEDVSGRGMGQRLSWRRPQPQQEDGFTERLKCGLSRTNPGCGAREFDPVAGNPPQPGHEESAMSGAKVNGTQFPPHTEAPAV